MDFAKIRNDNFKFVWQAKQALISYKIRACFNVVLLAQIKL